MDSSSEEIDFELLPVIRTYRNGRVERMMESERGPPSLEDPETGVQSKDIVISHQTGLSARLYLPKHVDSSYYKKLPVLVYIHGGGFCIESAFSVGYHRYVNKLVAKANAVAVSVEYRLAPEHPIPTAYEDCWEALQWVASHSSGLPGLDEPWLANYANFDRLIIGGDSAGANIVHNIVMRAGEQGLSNGTKILGEFLVQPYFWGSNRIGSENSDAIQKHIIESTWSFVSTYSIDHPVINPMAPNAPSLRGLGCTQVLVSVAGKDSLKDRGRLYCDELNKCGWKGTVEFSEIEEENHGFQMANPDCENAKTIINQLSSFLNGNCSHKQTSWQKSKL